MHSCCMDGSWLLHDWSMAVALLLHGGCTAGEWLLHGKRPLFELPEGCLAAAIATDSLIAEAWLVHRWLMVSWCRLLVHDWCTAGAWLAAASLRNCRGTVG